MEKILFAEKSEQERHALVRDNCDKIVEMDYMKQFDAEKINEIKDELSDLSVQIEDIEQEKAQTVKCYKDALKPLHEKLKKTIQMLKQKAEQVKEDCYMFIDQETGKVGYYNSAGILIQERNMKPEERQSNLHQLIRKVG